MSNEWKDGLPPVGERCAWFRDRSDKKGKVCEILWTDGEYFVVKNEESFKEVQLISNAIFRPIPQREPQAGEVWANKHGPWIYRAHGSWACLNDGKSSPEAEDKPLTYAAESVEEYCARQWLKAADGNQVQLEKLVTAKANMGDE